MYSLCKNHLFVLDVDSSVKWPPMAGLVSYTTGIFQLPPMSPTSRPRQFPWEPRKLVLSFVYFLFSSFLVSFSTVVVHNRLPDQNLYPPLPDSVLDRLPFLPWAFEVSEVVLILMFFTIFFVCLFHKHR